MLIHFHNVMAETRKWYRPDRRPYYTPEVSALCNPTIDSDFRKTPAALRAARCLGASDAIRPPAALKEADNCERNLQILYRVLGVGS